eukprot:PhM_4_TR14170/c6_g3_i3/m.47363
MNNITYNNKTKNCQSAFNNLVPNITTQTSQRHLWWCKTLMNENITTTNALINYIDDTRQRRQWKWSTTCTKIGELIGYAKRPIAYNDDRNTVTMITTDTFKAYHKFAQQKAAEEEVDYPTPLKQRHALAMLNDLTTARETSAAALLGLIWTTTARIGCALQLLSQNVDAGRKNRVKFTKGKGVKARKGPYTVHTDFGEFAKAIAQQKQRHHPHLFPNNMHSRLRSTLRTAMRKYNARYELRSPRRGALCHMADRGCPMKLLLQFSGHKRKETLLRYLNWGWHHGDVRKKATKYASYLSKRK